MQKGPESNDSPVLTVKPAVPPKPVSQRPTIAPKPTIVTTLPKPEATPNVMAANAVLSFSYPRLNTAAAGNRNGFVYVSPEQETFVEKKQTFTLALKAILEEILKNDCDEPTFRLKAKIREEAKKLSEDNYDDVVSAIINSEFLNSHFKAQLSIIEPKLKQVYDDFGMDFQKTRSRSLSKAGRS